MNRDLRRTVMVIVGAALLVLILALAGRQLEERQKTWDVPTIQNPKNPGLKFLYESLSDAGVPVRVLKTSLTGLKPTDGLVVLTTASRQVVSESEAADLVRWVEEGGTLLYANTLTIGGSPMDEHVRQALGLEVIDAPEMPLRWRVLLDASIHLYFPHPLKRGITGLSLDKTASHRIQGDDRYVPLAGEDDDIRMWLGQLGKGQVIVMDTSHPITNGHILKSDNLHFFTNMISLAGANRPVVFVEYYHHMDYSRTMLGLLSSEGLLVPLIQFALALLLLLAAAMPRFGDPLPLYRSVVHGAPDYIAAFADIALSRRSGDYRSLIRSRITTFQYQTGKRLGLPPMPTDAFLQRIGRMRVLTPHAEKLADLQQAYTSTDNGSPEELLRIARLCHRLHGSLFHPKAQ